MYDITIIGAGITGLTTALSLAQSFPKLKIAIISHHNSSNFNPVIAVNASNVRYLISLGVKIPKADHSTIEEMKIFSDEGSILEFDYLVNANYYSKIFSTSALISALTDKIVLNQSITIIQSKLEDIKKMTNEIEVKLHSNEPKSLNQHSILTINSKILIGADGIHSLVRKLANIELETIQYDQHLAITGSFACDHHHQNLALQHFLPNGGVIACLPYGYKKISIVYSSPKTDEVINQYIKNYSNDSSNHQNCSQLYQNNILNQHVSSLNQYYFGQMKLIDNICSYNLQMNLVETFYKNNIILVGDAAHSVHPLAGQGINLGFDDIKELITVFKKNQLWLQTEITNPLSTHIRSPHYQINQVNFDLALKIYNRRRMLAVRKIQIICHALFRLFNINLPLASIIRNKGMILINKSTLLKKIMLIR